MADDFDFTKEMGGSFDFKDIDMPDFGSDSIPDDSIGLSEGDFNIEDMSLDLEGDIEETTIPDISGEEIPDTPDIPEAKEGEGGGEGETASPEIDLIGPTMLEDVTIEGADDKFDPFDGFSLDKLFE